MISSVFEKLEKLMNGSLSIVNNKCFVGDGSYLPSNTYDLAYQYKESIVLVKNELGHKNIGSVSFTIPNASKEYPFEIKTRSILSQFFKRKSLPLIVSSEYLQLTNWIKQNHAFEKLCKRARIDRFEPVISGVNTKRGIKVSCNYHLVFNNKELVLEPLSCFFNDLIDFLCE